VLKYYLPSLHTADKKISKLFVFELQYASMILHFCIIFVLCRTTAGDEIWMPYLAIRRAYNFQAHESSAFIKVSMLLAAVYGVMGLNIEPYVPFN